MRISARASSAGSTRFALWAPTARNVAVACIGTAAVPRPSLEPLQRDAQTGCVVDDDRARPRGQYYTYLVDVHVRRGGLVRNRVTDPYSVGLTTDSTRSYVADLSAAR